MVYCILNFLSAWRIIVYLKYTGQLAVVMYNISTYSAWVFCWMQLKAELVGVMRLLPVELHTVITLHFKLTNQLKWTVLSVDLLTVSGCALNWTADRSDCTQVKLLTVIGLYFNWTKGCNQTVLQAEMLTKITL